MTLFVPADLGDAFLDASLRTSDPERRSFQRRDDEHVIWWAANLKSKKKSFLFDNDLINIYCTALKENGIFSFTL